MGKKQIFCLGLIALFAVVILLGLNSYLKEEAFQRSQQYNRLQYELALELKRTIADSSIRDEYTDTFYLAWVEYMITRAKEYEASSKCQQEYSRACRLLGWDPEEVNSRQRRGIENSSPIRALRKESQMAHLQVYWTFGVMAYYYNALNDVEKDSVLKVLYTNSGATAGIHLGMGSPVRSIAGFSLAAPTPREDFESFLHFSFMETDYMSAFYIEEGERRKLYEKWKEYIRERGLETGLPQYYM